MRGRTPGLGLKAAPTKLCQFFPPKSPDLQNSICPVRGFARPAGSPQEFHKFLWKLHQSVTIPPLGLSSKNAGKSAFGACISRVPDYDDRLKVSEVCPAR